MACVCRCASLRGGGLRVPLPEGSCCACLSQVAALCLRPVPACRRWPHRLRPVPACGLQAYKFVDSIAKILDFWQYCQHSEEEV